MQPLINAASPNGWIYNMTIPNGFSSPSTGKYTFTVTGNEPEHQPSFIFKDDEINRPFGFRRISSNMFINGKLQSTNVVLFIPETSLFIHSDIANNGQNDILQEIYSDNSIPFSNIVHKCTDIEAYSKKLTTTESDKFRFNITNRHGRAINFNGQDVLITLMVYRRDDLMTQYLKYIQYQSQYNSQQIDSE